MAGHNLCSRIARPSGKPLPLLEPNLGFPFRHFLLATWPPHRRGGERSCRCRASSPLPMPWNRPVRSSGWAAEPSPEEATRRCRSHIYPNPGWQTQTYHHRSQSREAYLAVDGTCQRAHTEQTEHCCSVRRQSVCQSLTDLGKS